MQILKYYIKYLIILFSCNLFCQNQVKNDTVNEYKYGFRVGIDISKQMIEIGNEKIKKNNISNKIDLVVADSENIPYPDNYFDAITIGFGVRNFENLELAMTEAYRVLKKNGCIVIMEPSIKNNKVLKTLFRLYFKTIVTNIGYLFSIYL